MQIVANDLVYFRDRRRWAYKACPTRRPIVRGHVDMFPTATRPATCLYRYVMRWQGWRG